MGPICINAQGSFLSSTMKYFRKIDWKACQANNIPKYF